jgi:streptomycin 6-kinase
MYGDPGYDPWPLLEQVDDPFAHPDAVSVLRRRVTLVGEVLGEDPSRLAAWAAARRIEAALWWVSRGNAPDQDAIAQAAALAAVAGL